MDKDEPEKSKLFMSHNPLNKNEVENNIQPVIKPSIYKIKIKKQIEPLKKDNAKNDISQVNDVNKTLNEEIDNNNDDIKNDKKEKNERYTYFQNDVGFEDDEISENNTPKEKPINNIYYKNNIPDKNQNNLQYSGELNKILQSSNKKDIKLLKGENQNDENMQEEMNSKIKKEIEEIEKLLQNEYIPHNKYIEKSKFLIILFTIGIILSFFSSISCFFLELYSNSDVLILINILSFFSIIIYILWIIFILKDKKYVQLIINTKGNPEKINNSKYRKFIILIIYFILTILNYFGVFMLVNTLYLNNTKLSIKGKAYDINQWIELFSNKNYSEIIQSFEKNNIIFLVCGWLNYLLMLFIYVYQFILLINYKLIKSTLQILCFLAIQGGIYQIYLSSHCYVFRDITSDEGIKISWVTPGTMATGALSLVVGFYGFYVFFMENKRGIIIFQLSCVVQFILLLVFTVSLGSIKDKFYNYKKASCNNLFKFISEDYLLKNKFNGCTSKYLSTYDNLENMECPKERIMINWERTENIHANSNKNENINNNDDISIININKKPLSYGCINQSCCLQIYFDIKNKFDLLFILSIHQIGFYIALFFTCFYMNCKIEDNLEEEFSEKINLLVFGILTLLILSILLPFISTLPNSSNQSKLNYIKNNAVSESLSIIQKDTVTINIDKLFQATNSSFNEVKQNIINDFKYNLMFDYLNGENFNFSLSSFEYSFTADGLEIMINTTTLKINFNNFENNYHQNSTQTIRFRTKNNIINHIFEYFSFIPKNPLKNNILLNIEINAIYSIKNADDKDYEKNEYISNYNDIIINGSDIINSYDESKEDSLVNILKKEINFSIMNKTEFFYIKGNINNDKGNSIINVYNYKFGNEPLYSVITEPNGTFIIGPIYRLMRNNTPYHLSIEISKIDFEIVNQREDEVFEQKSNKYIYNENYCKYYYFIKIDEYAFQTKNFYSIKNITLPEYKKGKIELHGNVIEVNDVEDEEQISYVNINLYYGEKINKVIEYIELNYNNYNSSFLDELSLDKTTTDKDGEYDLKIYETGQYMILFIKEDYYIEKHIFTIEEINEEDNIEIGTKQLIKLFNSGKIVVKLEWGSKPLDLDLICRFKVQQNLYCYTFFGNNKCGETEYFLDNKTPEESSSEIIEITEFSDYIYLFYVRKYFDYSNGKTQNEYKIEGVEDFKNVTEMYTLYDENLTNIPANIYIYSNGYKIPAIKIQTPDDSVINDNSNNDNKYIYWAAFCINGKEGINSLKIINQFLLDEPEKDICNSFYDEDKL